MSTTKTVSDMLTRLGQSLKSVVKMLMLSRRATVVGFAGEPHGRIIVMGNGPSLRNAIAEYGAQLASATTMAVNFAANAPEFGKLRPRYYVLADPHFFSGASEPNLERLRASLAAVDWTMTLCVPTTMRRKVDASIASNPNISIATFNAVGVEGFDWLETLAYSKGWGMPRPRNVLIPAIMVAATMGYRDIWIVGADHSWMQSIWVDDNNDVVSVQPHFYKDDERERKRVDSEYRGYRLHQIVHSFYVAFEAYHRIARWAASQGVTIVNATPGSYIDAFARDYRLFPED